MLAQKVKRIHNFSLLQLRPLCPAGPYSHPLKATGYIHYNAVDTGWYVQYWCGEHQKLYLLKDSQSDLIVNGIVRTHNLDQWVKIAQAETFYYSQRIAALTARCPICEMTPSPATGNLFYHKSNLWTPEYWCPYDEELFEKWERDKASIILEAIEGVEL